MPNDSKFEQRIAKCEEEIELLKGEWQNIPDLIEVRLRLSDSRVARLQHEMTGVKREMAELKGTVDALPRAMAEVFEEILDERDKRLAVTLDERDKRLAASLDERDKRLPHQIAAILDERDRRR